MYNYDKGFLKASNELIAGIDEAGRGPLAGPVSCAAVIMPLDDIVDGVNDSKKLSEKKREMLFDEIVSKAIAYRIVMLDNCVIDEINILNATKRAMKEAVLGLSKRPDIVLIDAVPLALPFENHSIIKGDAKSYNIACASILAKVSRDRLMLDYSKKYPEYLFEQHKGYGTKLHYEQIEKYGICEIHRKSFLKKILGE